MPARVVDGDCLWRSKKVKQLRPEFRAEYANLVPLAEANGVFDCDPERVWSDVYSFNRENVTVDTVESILADMVRVGLLAVWEDKGRKWGYWLGIEKSGRLPPKTHWSRYKSLPPRAPEEFLNPDFVQTNPGFLQSNPSWSGLDRYGLDRYGLEPAALNDETFYRSGHEVDMKTERQIDLICENFFGHRANLRGKNAEELKRLVYVHKGSAVERAFGQWASENCDNPDIKDPLAVFLADADSILSSDTPSQAAAKSPEAINLSRELSVLSGGDVAFNDKHRVRLSELLQEYSSEEILGAWKAWAPNQDSDPKFLAGNFVQAADNLCYAARRREKERREQDAAHEATRKRLQEEAEAERRLAEQREREQADLFDPIAG